MKKFLMILTSTIPVAFSAFGILPPLYETAGEIKALVTDPQLGQKLHSGELITTIQKNEKGYEIITNQHRIQVDVVYEPAERPGPAHYKLVFEDPIPLKNHNN